MSKWYFLSSLVGLTLFASMLIVYPLRRHLITVFFLIPCIFLMAFAGYDYWGGFTQWQEYNQQSKRQEQARVLLKSIKNPQELVDKLRAKLDNSPKSAKGWYLLGRLYSAQNEPQNALKAFAKAYHFNPNDEEYAVNYAYTLWLMNNQQLTQQVTGIFKHLLKNNPNQPDALAMLAMDAFISHAYEDAVTYWQRLLKRAPSQSKEAEAIRKAIAQAEEKIKLRDKSLN